MEISIKHLNMIKFALERWIGELEDRIEVIKSEDRLAIHIAELAEYENCIV